jgi:hypothetical protein
MPVRNYLKRREDVTKAVRLLSAFCIGRPTRTPFRLEIIFPVNDLTITVSQILELFDKRELNAGAVRKIVRESNSKAG